MFTIDGQNPDTSDSDLQDEGENLLVDLLKIDGLAQHAAWMSKLLTFNGDKYVN